MSSRKRNRVKSLDERKSFEKEADAKLLKAKANLLMKDPFYGTLALKLIYKPNWEIESAATDAVHFIYNPKFICKITPQETRGLIAHELHHIILDHQGRRQERNHARWNIACDYAINPHLIEFGHILPKDGLFDEQYKDMSAEAIYNKLPPEEQEEPSWGLVMDNTSASKQSEWQIAINEALSIAKSRGQLPGHLLELVEHVVAPKLNWKELLWIYFKSMSSNDYSWKKPNRAYISEDEYLPSFTSETLGSIAVIKDTSGSVNENQFTQFWGETCAIVRETLPQSLILVQCDYQVQDVKVFENYDSLDDVKCEIVGRGGTCFHPAITKVMEEFSDVEVIIYLTDLEAAFDDFGDEPPVPVLWISTDKNGKAPWGEVVYLGE